MALTQEQIDAIEAQVYAAIGKPMSMTTASGSVEMQSLASQLTALSLLKSSAATAGVGTLGVKFSRLRMGGMVN